MVLAVLAGSLCLVVGIMWIAHTPLPSMEYCDGSGLFALVVGRCGGCYSYLVTFVLFAPNKYLPGIQHAPPIVRNGTVPQPYDVWLFSLVAEKVTSGQADPFGAYMPALWDGVYG